MIICCLFGASGAAASHIYLTRLDVYLWLPAQNQVPANALSWLGEFAMHPALHAFLPQRATVHVHVQQIKYSNVSKTPKLHGWLLCRKLQLAGWKVEKHQFMWL